MRNLDDKASLWTIESPDRTSPQPTILEGSRIEYYRIPNINAMLTKEMLQATLRGNTNTVRMKMKSQQPNRPPMPAFPPPHI